MKLLERLVSIESVFPHERKLAELLEKELKARGFKVRRQAVEKGRFNLLAERGKKGKPLGFYGHMDTVPVYGKWESSPFTLRKKGDELHGLGAWDMKAGIAAILLACERKTDRKIKIAFGVDEENISKGGWAVAESGFFDDCEGVLVPESGGSEKEHLGPGMLTLGRRGRAVYEIDVKGVSAHGARAWHGANAIEKASEIVLLLKKMRMRAHPHLPKPGQFVSRIHAESTSVSIPDSCIIEVDRHMVPPETPESVLKEMQAFLRKNGIRDAAVRLKRRETPFLPAYMTDPKSGFVKRVGRAVRAELGKEPVRNYGLSVADENAIATRGVPVVTIGPKGKDDHSHKEWVSKRSYLELVRVLGLLVRDG
ncbi:MAG: M20 family metallopeptidase [Candidatus Bilamarchaeaceae archaeon]